MADNEENSDQYFNNQNDNSNGHPPSTQLNETEAPMEEYAGNSQHDIVRTNSEIVETGDNTVTEGVEGSVEYSRDNFGDNMENPVDNQENQEEKFEMEQGEDQTNEENEEDDEDDSDDDMTLGEMMEEEEEMDEEECEEEDDEDESEVVEGKGNKRVMPVNGNANSQKKKKMDEEVKEAAAPEAGKMSKTQKAKERKKLAKQQAQQEKPAEKVEAPKAAPKEQAQPKKKNETNVTAEPAKKTLKGGLVIEDIKVGNGLEAKSGQKVAVYYEGRLQKNNKKFDQSKNGPGFKFHLGAGEVIKGWDVGVQGMKIGGKRRLTVPAHMAYGKGGSPPVIPPNSTLVFEVELKGIN